MKRAERTLVSVEMVTSDDVTLLILTNHPADPYEIITLRINPLRTGIKRYL